MSFLVHVVSVGVTFFSFLIELDGGHTRDIKYEKSMNYSIKDLIEIPDEKIEKSLVAVKRCQEYIKLYSCFKMKSFEDKDPICIVAH
jgi:hypothetical protein